MARPAAAVKRSGNGTGKGSAPLPRAPRACVLALPPATGALPAAGLVLASPAAAVPRRHEHAGHAYQDLWREHRGYDAVDDNGTKAKAAAKAKAMASEDDDPEMSQAAKNLKQELLKDSDDFYDLLNLGDTRWRTPVDDIKKAFRKISLVYHPDKVCHLGEEALADAETHFKKVKKAYEVLSDKKKRMAFDSIDNVDDSIPSETSLTDENFFEKLSPVFELNARWSSANRTPLPGDRDTPIEEVNAFYDAWYGFKTWRDFSFDLEYDIDQAECREEKRWMERQNGKHIKKRKVEEAARIRKLVDTAFNKDPRIRAAKDAVRNQKEAIKETKRLEREAAENHIKEVEAKKQAEENAKIDAEKELRANAKKNKEAVRQMTRKARQNLRGIARERGLMDNDKALVDIEQCCSDLGPADIDAVAAMLGKTPSDDTDAALKLFADCLASPPSSREAAPETAAVSAESEASAQTAIASSSSGAPSASTDETAEPEWTHDEMKRLTKGMSKYPPGTRARNEKLAQFLGTRDVASVQKMVIKTRATKITPATAAAVAPIAAVASSSITDYENFQRDKKKSNVAAPPPSYTIAAEAASAAAGDKPVAQSVGVKPSNAWNFSVKQQAQLEASMKRHPAAPGGQDWDIVASEVTDRSPVECEKRYMELVQFYKAKKASTKA
jgi:DnaJ homolog subfamily C member 2